MPQLPLTRKTPHQVLVYRNGHAVTVGQFLDEVLEIAGQLPAGRYNINLCQNRYRFTRAFAATLLARQTNLLPPNRLSATVEDIRARYPQAHVLTDDPGDLGHLDQARRITPPGREADSPPIPEIHSDHLAAIVFTSGSTGHPNAIEKPWGTLFESTRINASQMGLDGIHLSQLVATVPPQHMYGLETSVLLPLLGGVTASSAQPFMPADIASALQEVPRPRVLVSTPPHLRALADPALQLPPLDAIWSATAPLDPELASAIETQHSTQVNEIYGCSETGCLAQRRPSRGDAWALFPSFHLVPEGDRTRAMAPHLPRTYYLQDHLEHLSENRFHITGRSEDLVNIAGKRTSLAHLNQCLMRVPGIQDGVIFMPPDASSSETGRLAALVVAPQLEAEGVREALRDHMDEVFLPRLIRFVDQLPRTGTGKLPHKAVVTLYKQVR